MSDKNLKLTAELREKAGKGTARAIRREEKLPAVIYGGKESPVTVSLSAHDFTIEYMKGKIFTTLVDLNVGGKDHLVLARDVQLHPVTDNVLHVDFLRVTEKTTLVVSVPVTFIDEDKSPGIQTKGLLNTVRHEVDIVCKATNIPDEIEVSLAGKEHGDSINMSDAKMPEGARSAIDDRDVTIAVLNAPKRIAVETTEAEDAEGETAEGEGAEEASSEE